MNGRLTVATVLKPQGIRGEIKVKALTDSASDLVPIKKISIDGVEYSVLSVRAQGEYAYLSLKGVADRNCAELLRGKEICAEREDLPPLPEGRYYIADLIGCAVVTEMTPAKTDIYTLSDGAKTITFAAADGVISDIDVTAKRITVNYKRFKEVSL